MKTIRLSLVETYQVHLRKQSYSGFQKDLKPWTILRHHCKLDADLILPNNYFETIVLFEQNPTTGMAGGFAYIEKNGIGF
jgi:hypothetical protein